MSARATTRRAQVQRKIVLVVDDDLDMLSLLERWIERTGRYAVALASGGHEGVRKAKAEAPDLIVCDIDMPDLDGGSVAASLSEDASTAAIPMLFLSSLVAEQDTIGGEIGGWPMLSKRSPSQRVIARIDELLAGA